MLRPRGVVLLGGTAGKAVYGPGFKVGERRGVLRAGEGRRAAYDGLVGDLRVAAAALGGG